MSGDTPGTWTAQNQRKVRTSACAEPTARFATIRHVSYGSHFRRLNTLHEMPPTSSDWAQTNPTLIGWLG